MKTEYVCQFNTLVLLVLLGLASYQLHLQMKEKEKFTREYRGGLSSNQRMDAGW